MRTSWLAGAAILIGGCGDHPELHIDVVRSGDAIQVMAIEVARPDACHQRPFVELGVCDATTDVIGCDSADPDAPAAWLGEVRVEQRGQVLARGRYAAPSGAYLSGAFTGATGLVVHVDDDGAPLTIPLPDVVAPAPTIDSLTPAGGNLTIAWSASPAAASAVVQFSYGFGGPRCHVGSAEPVVFAMAPSSQSATIAVQAFAAPTTIASSAGQIHVWTGAAVEAQLPVP
jgi:hypothetical protein